MAPTKNSQILYVRRPINGLDPDLQSGTFSLSQSSIPSQLPSDKVLVRVHFLSLDPAMRQWLTAKRSYVAPVELGAVMRGQSVAQVIEVGGQIKKVKRGDWVIAYSGWQEYAVLGEKEVSLCAPVGDGVEPRDYLGNMGVVALTAYFGLLDVGAMKTGDVVVVSGAAGATGMVAGQIAKARGAKKVVGIAGSKDKCNFLVEELGFDVAINYKDEDFRKQLSAATPEYIDVFFDNVGGDILDACLGRAALNSRYVLCGAISQYNTSKPKGPASIMVMISQRVTMKGFIVFDFASRYSEGRKELAQMIKDGKLKRKEHIIKGGLRAAPAGLVSLYEGANTGKMMVEIASVNQAIEVGSKL